MSNIVSLIVGLLGIIGLALAAYYWLTPAGSLLPFVPGYEAGSDHIHTSHAIGCLVVGLILLAVGWFSRPREIY